MAEFNVRVLLVYMGAFDTPMATQTRLVAKPLDADYRDTTLKKYYEVFRNKAMVIKGDHKKAVKAIYEVVVGEGAGMSLARERQIVLGKDCAVRVDEVRQELEHMMEVCGGICNNVDIDAD